MVHAEHANRDTQRDGPVERYDFSLRLAVKPRGLRLGADGFISSPTADRMAVMTLHVALDCVQQYLRFDLGGDFLIREMRCAGPLRGMLDRNGTNVALSVNVECGVLI